MSKNRNIDPFLWIKLITINFSLKKRYFYDGFWRCLIHLKIESDRQYKICVSNHSLNNRIISFWFLITVNLILWLVLKWSCIINYKRVHIYRMSKVKYNPCCNWLKKLDEICVGSTSRQILYQWVRSIGKNDKAIYFLTNCF